MPSTTVHLPDDLLARVDRLARRRGTSRNRVVIRALEQELARDAGEWPPGFFDSRPAEELAELREATRELDAAVVASRRNRGAPLL